MATSATATTTPQQRLIRHQEILIAELNHRARNSLQIISHLIEQSAAQARSVNEFVQVVNDRVKAMARAHDLLTKKDWQPAPFHDLLGMESAALGPLSRGRITTAGADVLIMPEACSTITLVLHELMTNAAKYGALSGPGGTIQITSSWQSGDTELKISWCEQGVTSLVPTQHEGFGTTIIKGSIPYELNGRVSSGYRPDGFWVDFVIPAQYVQAAFHGPQPHLDTWIERSKTEQSVTGSSGTDDPKTQVPVLSGTALLVEDSMLMALGAERYLISLGADRVLVCHDCETALTALTQDDAITFCLLDVNLNGLYSTAVAQALDERAIPYILATGYALDDQTLANFPDAPVITKPYEKSDISQAARPLMMAATQ
ncbi:MAG: HWE histidine kinase domain-containing protein [Pseudomonadota bacterium]